MSRLTGVVVGLTPCLGHRRVAGEGAVRARCARETHMRAALVAYVATRLSRARVALQAGEWDDDAAAVLARERERRRGHSREAEAEEEGDLAGPRMSSSSARLMGLCIM